MSLESDLYAALSPLASARVYPDFAPEGAALPYIVYQQVGGVAVNYLESAMPDKRNARVQVAVWATTRSEANTLARSVESTLVTNTTLRAFVLGALVADFDEDVGLYGARQDFSINY